VDNFLEKGRLTLLDTERYISFALYCLSFIIFMVINVLDHCFKPMDHAFSLTMATDRTLKGYNIIFCSRRILNIGGFICILSRSFHCYV
jgi:hypothetical protein